MRKKILSLLLVLCLTVTAMSVPVFASEDTQGQCGENLTWKLSGKGVLTISGTGEMYDYKDQDPPWRRSWKNIKTVKVKDGVTGIGDNAFWACSKLTAVTLADSVKAIGWSAFSNCPITKIDLPANLTVIEERAFETTKIASIKLPSKLKKIGERSFSGTLLTEITIPASVTDIGNEQGSPFVHADKLKKIEVSGKNKYYCAVDGVLFNKKKTELIQYPMAKSGSSYKIPSSVKTIGDYAFYGTKLKKITIPNGVKKIGMSSFYYVKKLTEIEIPESVESIGSDAFDVCYKLEKFTVSKDNKYFSSKSGVLFNKDKTKLICYPAGKTAEEYTVPNTVEYINGGAFVGNKKLITLTLPKKLKETGGWLVEGCNNLSAVIFKGDAPKCEFPRYIFSWDGNLVYYPANNKTWTKEVVDLFNEENLMRAYDPKMPTPVVTASNNYTTGQIKLTWGAVEGAASYWVFKASKEDGEYSYIGSTKKTSFTDKSNHLEFDGRPDPGEKYYYKVAAVTEDYVFSLDSNTVARTCNLPRVAVTAKNTSSGKVKLSWKSVSGARKYTVYRSTKENGTYKKIGSTEKASFTDSTGKVGKRYYYKVVAVHKNTAANSAKSKAVSAKRK